MFKSSIKLFAKEFGEKAVVDLDTVNSFFTEKWPLFEEEFSACDIINADMKQDFFSKHILHMHLSWKGGDVPEENEVKKE